MSSASAISRNQMKTGITKETFSSPEIMGKASRTGPPSSCFYGRFTESSKTVRRKKKEIS